MTSQINQVFFVRLVPLVAEDVCRLLISWPVTQPRLGEIRSDEVRSRRNASLKGRVEGKDDLLSNLKVIPFNDN